MARSATHHPLTPFIPPLHPSNLPDDADLVLMGRVIAELTIVGAEDEMSAFVNVAFDDGLVYVVNAGDDKFAMSGRIILPTNATKVAGL